MHMAQLQKDNIKVWGASVPAAGAISQVRGVGEALDPNWRHLNIELYFPYSFFPTSFFDLMPRSAIKKSDLFFNQFPPDILITCGRKAIAFSLAMKRCYQQLITIHIQNPIINPSRFDIVIAPAHDGLRGKNVIQTIGSVHNVNQESLGSFVNNKSSFLQPIDSEFVLILVGGANAHHPFVEKDIESLLEISKNLLSQGNHVVLLPSRRTPKKAVDRFVKFADGNDFVFCWDRTGESPYMECLARSSHILVTQDSVSMISEACSTGKPVMIVPLYKKRQSKRFNCFYKVLFEKDIARMWSGNVQDWSPFVLNEMDRVVREIRQFLINN